MLRTLHVQPNRLYVVADLRATVHEMAPGPDANGQQVCVLCGVSLHDARTFRMDWGTVTLIESPEAPAVGLGAAPKDRKLLQGIVNDAIYCTILDKPEGW